MTDNPIIDIVESMYDTTMSIIDSEIEDIHEAQMSLLLDESYIPILDDDAENRSSDIDISKLDMSAYDIEDGEFGMIDIMDKDIEDIDVDENEIFDDEGVII